MVTSRACHKLLYIYLINLKLRADCIVLEPSQAVPGWCRAFEDAINGQDQAQVKNTAMSAHMATLSARCSASAPTAVIICVPLIRASPVRVGSRAGQGGVVTNVRCVRACVRARARVRRERACPAIAAHMVSIRWLWYRGGECVRRWVPNRSKKAGKRRAKRHSLAFLGAELEGREAVAGEHFGGWLDVAGLGIPHPALKWKQHRVQAIGMHGGRPANEPINFF